MPIVVCVEVNSQRERTEDDGQRSDLANHIGSFDGLAENAIAGDGRFRKVAAVAPALCRLRTPRHGEAATTTCAGKVCPNKQKGAPRLRRS
jgi:hypothetical protein